MNNLERSYLRGINAAKNRRIFRGWKYDSIAKACYNEGVKSTFIAEDREISYEEARKLSEAQI